MSNDEIRHKIFFKVKSAAKELQGNLKVTASTVKAVNVLISQAPPGSSEEDIATGVFQYLKENNLFTAKGEMKSISTRASAKIVSEKVNQTQQDRERKETTQQQTVPVTEQEAATLTSDTSSAASSPRTPTTEEDANKKYDPTRAMGAMASIVAKDREDAIREIKKQELIRQAVEEQIKGDIQRFREEQKQTLAIIDQRAERIHAKQKGDTKKTLEEIKTEQRQKAIDDGSLKENHAKAEEEIVARVIQDYRYPRINPWSYSSYSSPS